MSRSDLAHLSEGAALAGVDLTRDEAAALNATKLVTVTPDAGSWKVVAAHLVGAVRCGDLVVRVAPKVGAIRVLELLAFAQGFRGFTVDRERLGLAGDADLSAVLAILFEREAREALAARPLRGYRVEDQSLPVVRGRVRLVDQNLRRFGLLTPIEVTVDEWTLDTDDNRRLRAATRVLLGLPSVPRDVAAGLRRVDRLLADVQMPPRGAPIAPWNRTRLNRHLHGLLHLADLVLGGLSVEHRAGDVVAHGFVVNMAWLFEALVAQLLREQCSASGRMRLAAQKTHLLTPDGTFTIKPDLVLLDDDIPVLVADTKYKLLDDHGDVPNADAYQLVTYCRRLGLREGWLLYASNESKVLAPQEIIGADVVLHLQGISLQDEIADIRHAVGALVRQAPARPAPSHA